MKHERAKIASAATSKTGDAGLTPMDRLVRAAERGQFEAVVRKARPAKPAAMVTPQQREAELRAAGQWPADKPAPQPAPRLEPAPEAAPAPREMTANEQYRAEYSQWRPRGAVVVRREPATCVTEYDPLEEEGDDE